MRKLIVGIVNTPLKKEVYRKCEDFDHLDALRSFCVAFESTTKDVKVFNYCDDNVSAAASGAPEIISTDGGTNLVSEEMKNFFERWGVQMRVSSAYYPQSNGRAEAAVKSAKRLLMSNTGVGGSLDTDKATLAILQYLNTPLRDIDKSPAQLAAGRQLRDGVPATRQHYKVNVHWRRSLRDREVNMAEKHQDIMAKSGSQRSLPALKPGNRVWIQNQTTKKWDKSGTVTEVLAYRQYSIRLDGSGRISRRNRVHLKSISDSAVASQHQM